MFTRWGHKDVARAIELAAGKPKELSVKRETLQLQLLLVQVRQAALACKSVKALAPELQH